MENGSVIRSWLIELIRQMVAIGGGGSGYGSVIVMAEVIRAGRFRMILLRLWIAAAPWILSGASSGTTWKVVGLVIAVLALPRGPVYERYATWDRLVV